jgi:large subunit ribosomal protein L35Ae
MEKGLIVQFRRGPHRIHERHFLLDFSMKDREDARKIVGKEVSWKSSSGKEIKGKIAAPHGNKGLVRAIFERGLPGQAITEEVTMTDSKSEKPKKEVKKEKKE